MKIKSIIFFFLAFNILVSCKTEKKEIFTITPLIKKTDTTKRNSILIPNIQTQKEYSKNILEKVDIIEKSDIEPNGGGKYKKNGKTLFLDILEEMETHEKHIMYMLSHHDKNNERNNEIFSFYTDTKGSILIAVYEFNQGKGKNHRTLVKDTFFFKNNKIYFWKNKQATNEELLKKEKEILAIKKEIDSVMEW